MTLPTRSGLAFEVDASLRGILTLGWLEADGLSTEDLGEGFEHERDDALQRVVSRMAGRSAGDLPGMGENRRMFHRLGVDPTKCPDRDWPDLACPDRDWPDLDCPGGLGGLTTAGTPPAPAASVARG